MSAGHTMTFGSLFAGIGGFDLGLERAGMKCLWQCEKDHYALKVLEKHWPNVRRYDDITTIDATALAPVDLICGGFPCQPFSVAGKRKGAEDDRFLWPAMLKVIETVRPTWVLGENVPGLISLGLDSVLSDLEGLGYATRAFVVPACAVDAKHRRDRLWVVAHTNCVVPERRQSERPGIWDAQDGEGANGDVGGPSERYENVAHSTSEQDNAQRRTGGFYGGGVDWSWQATFQEYRETSDNGTRRHGEGSRRCGYFGYWQPEPDVGRVAHGVSSALDGALRKYGIEHLDDSEAFSTLVSHRLRVLLSMWGNGKSEPSPRNVYGRECDNPLPEVPHADAHEQWYLGRRIKENEELRGMWDRICSQPFQETQDMQREMLVRIGESERHEKVASSRVNRLKALGNAVVPQVVEMFGRFIMESSK